MALMFRLATASNLPPKNLRDGRVIMAIPDQPWPSRSPRRRRPCRGVDSSPSRCAGRTGGGTRKAVPTTALVRSQSDLSPPGLPSRSESRLSPQGPPARSESRLSPPGLPARSESHLSPQGQAPAPRCRRISPCRSRTPRH